MKRIQGSRIHRLIAAIGLGMALAALLLLTLSPVSAQPPVPHDVVFLIDNSPSVRIGDTDGDGKQGTTPTDEQDVRLRMARFVVNVLGLDLTSDHQRVGVISFARSKPPLTLMPPTPVRDWSKADFAAIREVNQGSGTDFATAINAASDMLFPTGDSSCSPNVRRCDIVMVTDGSFHDTGQDRDVAISQTEEALFDLPSDVSMHILTFEADDRTVWQGFLAEKLISTYQPNVTVNSTVNSLDQVYGTVLGNLGAEALLEGLTSVVLDGEKSITLNVLPFRTWMRYQILADAPLTVTFFNANQVVTPVVAGTEYTFFQPQAGKWNVRFQGDGLAYYRQAGEGVADLALYLRAPYGTMPLGSDVPIEAGITAGGAPITDTPYFTVTAIITGPGLAIDSMVLTQNLNTGCFTASVPASCCTAGMYTVTLTAESVLTNVPVQAVVGRSFELVARPTLSVTVWPSRPIEMGHSACVTVTTENWKSEYTLEGWLTHPDGTTSTIPLQQQDIGVYAALVNHLTQTMALVVQIIEPQGADLQVAILSVQRTAKPDQNWWLVIGVVLAVVLAVVLSVFFLYLWAHQRTRSGLAKRFAENPDDSDTWKEWKNLSLSSDWLIIKTIGEKFAREWREQRANLGSGTQDSTSALAELFMPPESQSPRWREFFRRLEDKDIKAMTVLTYAGLRVSVVKDYGGDRIPCLEALEGMGLNGAKKYRFIGQCLDCPSYWQTFHDTLESFEDNEGDLVIEDTYLAIWKAYDTLVQYARGISSEIPEGSFIKLVEAAEQDNDLAVLFSQIKVKDPSKVSFGSHPLLENVWCRRWQKLGGR